MQYYESWILEDQNTNNIHYLSSSQHPLIRYHEMMDGMIPLDHLTFHFMISYGHQISLNRKGCVAS